MADFAGLSISGRVATPEDADWDEARAAWNLAADQHPDAVALVESPDDVAEAIAFADEKCRWDPDDRIVANHAVSLATA